MSRQRTLHQGDCLAQYGYIAGEDAVNVVFQREKLLTASHQTLQCLRVNLHCRLVAASYLQCRFPFVLLIFKMFIFYHVAKINIFLSRYYFLVKIKSETE